MKNLSCPNRNLPEWKALVAKVGTFEAYRDYLETNGEIRDPDLVLDKLEKRDFKKSSLFRNKNRYKKPGTFPKTDLSLFGLDTENKETLEFHVNTINVVSTFLENIGIEQRLVPSFLQEDGTIVEGAIAAANFVKGTVDIIDDLEKRPGAWNKLPEEAAHWWYRLLKENSPLKEELFAAALYSDKFKELKDQKYAGLTKDSDITEEAIGQMIAESIKRIEDKNGSPKDYSFLKKFIDWINKLLSVFKNTEQDPFEVAAMKILSSDVSDLLTFEEYKKLNDAVYFTTIMDNESVAPLDYTLLSNLGEVVYNTYFDETEQEPITLIAFADSPWFSSKEELDTWTISKYGNLYERKQKIKLQEVKDNQVFFDRLINKSFKKRTRFLPKTLRRYYDIIDASNMNNLQSWNISSDVLGITKNLSESEKELLVKTNGYTNIAPTLKVLPLILQKYKKHPIVLSEKLKVDGIKKEEASIIENIKALIKSENPDKKSITAEELVNEVHAFLEVHFMLGFANEQNYLSYNVDQTFVNVPDRISNDPSPIADMTDEEIAALPFDERQRVASILGLTKKNPSVYHNKISLRFNDKYHLQKGHFQYSPSAWANLTYFYTGNSKLKDAVLLHEIQNDNIEFLRNYKIENIDLEKQLNLYLTSLNEDLLANITQIESGGKKIVKSEDPFNTAYLKVFGNKRLNYYLQNNLDTPIEQSYEAFVSWIKENISLYEANVDDVFSISKANNKLSDEYITKRRVQDFIKRGGFKTLFTTEEIKSIEEDLKNINSSLSSVYDFETGTEVEIPSSLRDKKIAWKKLFYDKYQIVLFKKFKEIYGEEFPSYISFDASAKPLPKSQRRNQIVNIRGQEVRTGNAQNALNTNINFLFSSWEKKLLDNTSKAINDSKKVLITALNQSSKYNFDSKLVNITLKQYKNLVDNFKYNLDLLKESIDLQSKEDVKTGVSDNNVKAKAIIDYLEKNKDKKLGDGEYTFIWDAGNTEKGIVGVFDTEKVPTEKDSYVDNWTVDAFLSYVNKVSPEYSKIDYKSFLKTEQEEKAKTLRERALEKKKELSEKYGKLEEEVKQTLDVEMGYFTPLIHYVIQKHIKQAGKEVPMYFSGYEITKLTQGSTRTALIYAGKDEVSFTKEEADIIKYKVAERLGLVDVKFSQEGYNKLDKEQLDFGIKKLSEYKKQSKSNLDRVVYETMNVSKNKPIETGAIYNAMTQIPGIKLIWQPSIQGIKNDAGGYLVDLSNYNYNQPILYGLDTSNKNFKRDLEYYQGDEALMEQEEGREEELPVEPATEVVKPGVQELFESNPELANDVYEALGFKTNITQDNKSYYRGQIEQPTIDKDGNLVLYGREDELYKRAGLKSYGVSMTDDLQSAIDYGNGQLEVAQNVLEEEYGYDVLGYDFENKIQEIQDNGYYLIQIPKDISNEVVKEAGEVKIIGDKIIIPKGQYKIEQVIDGIETPITPQQKQQALQLYSQYLDTIFPDSKVKDIVYHVNKTGIISSEDGRKFYSTSSGSWLEELEEMKGTRIPIILNITNPTIVDSYYEFTDKAEKFRESGLGDEYVTPDEVRESGTDSVIGRDSGQGGNEKTYVTYSSNQVYQLGSKQDIEGFKEFTRKEIVTPEGKRIITRKPGAVKEKVEKPIDRYKKAVGLSSNKINGARLSTIKIAERKYNKRNDTDYEVSFQRIGESDTYTYTITGGLKPGNQLSIRFYRYDDTNTTAPENLIPNSTFSNEVLSKLPVEYNQEVNNKELGKRMISTIGKRIAENLGIAYENVTAQEAAELTSKADIQWNGEPAFFIGDTVYFVGENTSEATQLHEFAHPLVRAILVSNPQLFNNLYNKVANSVEGQQVIAEVSKRYPEYAKESDRFKEEVIVRATEKAAVLQRQNYLASNPFIRAIQDILYQFKKLFRQLFGKVKVSSLDVNTSIDELADMLQNEFFDIKQDIISLKDQVAYQRTTDEFRNELNEIIEKDPAGLQSIADQMYKLSSDYLYELEKDENYEALKEILKDQFSSNDLIEIKAGISNYQKVVIRKARQVREDIEFRRNQSAAIVQNIQRVFQIATKINDYMKEVAKEEATPDSVNKMHYYSTMLNDIKEFSDMVATVLDQNDLGTSKLGDYVNAIKGRVDASQKYSSKVYAEGVSNVLYSFIEDTNKALIERKKDRIDSLKSKNARPDLIASEEARFDALIIDKDKFIATLNGNLGDQGALSAFFESYAGNPDPIIASFGLYIKKHIYDVLYKTRDRIYDLHKDLVPALEKAGYKGTNPEEFFKDLVHLEKTFSVENNEEKINQFDYALLAPVKGSDYYYAKQRFLKQKLKQQAIDSGDYTEYAKFLKDESLYMRKYFNQEHSDEYYDLDKIYDKDYSYTDEFGEKQTINGWEAYAQLESINQELKLIEDDPMEDLDIQQKTRDKEVVLRKRARLFDLRYENGKPKVGKDLAIAEILNEYKQAARPFVEYIPRPDAFQKYLLRYEEMLTARGITGDDFNKLRENFIIANTEIAYEDKYYQDLASASQELKDLYASIPNYKNGKKSADALEEIASALLGYRDENGQPMANDMSEDRIQRVKKAEELLDKLKNDDAGLYGLNSAEMKEFSTLVGLIKSKKKGKKGPALTEKQQERFDYLSEKRGAGLSSIQLAKRNEIFAKFSDVRTKEATSYYIDKFNSYLTKVNTDVLDGEFGVREIDRSFAEIVTNSELFSNDNLMSLLNQDEEFKKWFMDNHIKIEYEKRTEKGGFITITKYKRVGVWSVNRPVNDEYYKKTKIKDANGNVVETINRVPSFKFRERKIKDKVEIKDEYGRIIKTINNKTPRIVGETVDNRNRWLPKSIEQGAPQDSPFINNEYYALKNNNPDKFKALEILKKFHLATQEGLDNQSKNYLYIPRYGKELSEKIQTKGALKEKRNKLTEAFTTIKEVFVARPDDYEKGLNYKPENQYMSIASDVFNDEESSIAITGLSNMEYSAVSLDLPKSLMKFGLAAERQKKLTEIWPISNALSQLLSDPKASLTIEKMVNSQYVNRQLAIKPSKKSNSQRAQSAKNIIDKEFKGINLKGFGADQAWLVKGVSNMMKAASFGFFGLDLQSASTNTLGMYFQSIIESVGGKDLNSANLAAGSYWANTTLMRQLTMSIYSKGQNKPLELQMWEVFDPAQGRLQAKMSEELSRTLGRDMMNLSFIYSPRKFGELSNMASMWGGMMMQKKIEQKVGNTTKEISYLEAWETGLDGKLKLRDGIDKSYDVGGNQFRLFQNKVHEKMRKLGSVADYDSPEANRLLVFRMVSFLRRHLIPMIVHRMGFSGKPWNPKESVNYASGDAQMGTYIRTLKELFRAFKYGGENIKYMDKQDAAAFYRAVTEIGMLIACNIALYWIFGYDPDDEDRFKKLRKKSGPLPTPWTDEETMRRYPFNLQGWLANHATYQLIKVRAENESFLPLPGFGLDDYSKLIEFDAGAIFSPTIGNGTKVLTGLWDYSMGNPSAYYKKDVGAYEFQQAEGLKALNYLAKMFGITGKTTDPVMAIKNFTSIQAKTSGSTSGRRRKEEERDSDNSYLIR